MIYALWTEPGDVHRSMIQQPMRQSSLSGIPVPPHKLIGLNSMIARTVDAPYGSQPPKTNKQMEKKKQVT